MICARDELPEFTYRSATNAGIKLLIRFCNSLFGRKT
jgi:hypothetical protein